MRRKTSISPNRTQLVHAFLIDLYYVEEQIKIKEFKKKSMPLHLNLTYDFIKYVCNI